MRVLAALAAGVFVYLAAGYLTGNPPQFTWRLSDDEDSVSDGQLWLQQAGIRTTPVRFWAVSASVAFVAFLIGLSVTGAPWVALPPAAGVFGLPRWYFARKRVQRLSEVQEAWPDGLRHLMASVRTGMSMPVALEELARTGPDALREAFARYPTLARVFGVRPALESIRDDLADPTTDRVVEVLVLAYERGGPFVTEILQELAEATTQDVRTLEEIRTNSLEQRINARIVFAVPWFVLLLMTSRQGLYRDFYQSSAGFLVVVVAAVLSLAGSFIVMRLSRDHVEERVFGSVSTAVRR